MLSEGYTGRTYELKAETTTVGRVSDNAFEIPEASVSSHHAELVLRGNEWRAEELAWQLEGDRKSPKVGDFAPDFELQDPEGNVSVRLSDFRGKRPVALVFGSYT